MVGGKGSMREREKRDGMRIGINRKIPWNEET